MKNKIFLIFILISVIANNLTKTEFIEQNQKITSEPSKAMLTPEVATCFNNLGFYFYDDMGGEARSVYKDLQENKHKFAYSTLIPALIQIVDLADKKSLLERVAPPVQTYFAQFAAEEANKHEKTRAYGSGYPEIPYVLNLLVDQALQVGSYLTVNGIAVVNKLAVLDALRVPANSISGAALIDNSVPDCKLQTIVTPCKVANSATTATSSNIPNTIVLRDNNGNFSAGTITANLNGTATNAINCLNCPTGTPENTPDTLVRRASATDMGFRPGSFAAQDVVVNGNINITTNPSTADDGNILKGGELFIHNFNAGGIDILSNTFVGLESGNTNMTLTGTANTALGNDTLSVNTTGTGNTAVGRAALQVNTIGTSNTAVGSVALQGNSTGTSNTAIGISALRSNTTGSDNTAVGSNAIGNSTTPSNNVAVGNDALQQGGGTLSNNVAIGVDSLNNLTTGSSNTAIGFDSGTILLNGNNNIYVGASTGPTGINESNTIRIGVQGTQTATFIAGIFGATVDAMTDTPVLIDSTGKLGTTTSSRRYKENIAPMADDTQRLLELEPVMFTYKGKDSGKQYGLIAEDVAEKLPELVIYKDGQPESVRYHLIAVMLLNEVKKLAARVDKQQETIDSYIEHIRQLRSLIVKNAEIKTH